MKLHRSHPTRAFLAAGAALLVLSTISVPTQAQLRAPAPPPRTSATMTGLPPAPTEAAPASTPGQAPAPAPGTTPSPTATAAPTSGSTSASAPVPAAVPGTAPAPDAARTLPNAAPSSSQPGSPAQSHSPSPSPATQATGPAVTFKTSVALVPVSAVVRDGKGRIVRNLSRNDFQVLERGKPREIVDFMVSDQGPVSVALLFDVSGSMRLEANMRGGRLAAGQLLSWLKPGTDEVALYSFDKDIREEVGFTRDPERVRAGLGRLHGRGMTSLYDAVAQTARTLADRPSLRRAVVVITDGGDNSSRMTADEVTALASRIDVPLYVIAVVSPLDHPGSQMSVVDDGRTPAGAQLASLAAGTGGSLTVVSAPAHANIAARELIAELRHQYVLAFESAATPGWHALDIKTQKRDLKVRARTGYWAKS